MFINYSSKYSICNISSVISFKYSSQFISNLNDEKNVKITNFKIEFVNL